VNLGAQDVSSHKSGAYTGEVSAEMIAETDAKYVIVGHSERRMYHDETNDIVRAKAQMALQAGLTPIICVG
jgi:triosephosphate isomerase